VAAERHITEAAQASTLLAQATENTRAMLTRLLASLGMQAVFPAT
jgi:Protein of unknown function (DUF4230)